LIQDALRSVLAVIAAGVVLCLTVLRAYDLDLIADRVSGRVSLMALPVCVSDLYRGGRHDFTGFAQLRGVANHYFYTVGKGSEIQSDGGRLIPAMLQAKITSPGSLMYWGYDDRGLGDYCIAAFTIFGPAVESFSKLWLLLLALSAAAFLMTYHRHQTGPPVLLMFLASAYLGLGLYSFMQAPVSLSEERAFEYLSFLPALHLALFPFLGRHSGRVGLAGLVIQAALFVFLYHSRSSIGWQILPVLGSIVIAVLARRTRFGSSTDDGSNGRERVRTALLPLLALAGFMVLLMAYTRVTYHPAYFGEEGGRTFYHNALMGLHDMEYVGEPRQGINDNLVKTNVSMFVARQRGVPVSQIKYVSQFGAAYERDAQSYYFHLVRKDPIGTARYYLEKKILASLHLLKQRSLLADGHYGYVRIENRMRLMSDPGVGDYVREKNLLFSPLATPISILSVILAVLFARGRASGVGPALLVAAMFFVAGLIPSTLFYNQDLRQLSGSMLSLGLIAHLAALWALTTLWSMGARLRPAKALAATEARQGLQS
jgi:hypothetical protein